MLETRIKHEREGSFDTVAGDDDGEMQWTGTRLAKRGKGMLTAADEVSVLENVVGDEWLELEE